MKLVRILNPEGATQVVKSVPNNALASMSALRLFLCDNARELYGPEGKSFRVCQSQNRHALVPLYVNQIIVSDGRADYGESLVVQ